MTVNSIFYIKVNYEELKHSEEAQKNFQKMILDSVLSGRFTEIVTLISYKEETPQVS